jgi:hypothetical protein
MSINMHQEVGFEWQYVWGKCAIYGAPSEVTCMYVALAVANNPVLIFS